MPILLDTLGLEEIHAIVHPDNAASIRVLEKLGFAYEGDVFHEKLEADVRHFVANRQSVG